MVGKVILAPLLKALFSVYCNAPSHKYVWFELEPCYF